MQIRSIRDIPDEIKCVAELYYAGNQNTAYSEAESLHAARKDLRELTVCVLQLFEQPPSSLYAFYDSLIAVSSAPLSTEGFQLLQFDGDDDEFATMLAHLLEDGTKFPSTFSDKSVHRTKSKHFALSGPKLSAQAPKSGTDISLNIDLDFDFDIDIDITPSAHSDSKEAIASAPLSQPSSLRLMPPDISSGTGRTTPSIMRAVQKSLQHEDSRNAKRLDNMTSAFSQEAISSAPFLQKSPSRLTPPSDASSGTGKAAPSILHTAQKSFKPGDSSNARRFSSKASAFSQEAISLAPFLQKSPSRLTPPPNGDSSLGNNATGLGKAAPSIVRAAQKSPQHEDSRNAKRLAELTKLRASSSLPCSNSASQPWSQSKPKQAEDTRPTAHNLVPIAAPEARTAATCHTTSHPPPSNNHATVVQIQPLTQDQRRQPEIPASQTRPTAVQATPVPGDRRSNPSGTGQRTPSSKVPTLETDALCSLYPLARIPRLLIAIHAIGVRCDMDARTGFILSHIDGKTTLADLIDLSVWPETETASIILALKSQGIITFDVT